MKKTSLLYMLLPLLLGSCTSLFFPGRARTRSKPLSEAKVIRVKKDKGSTNEAPSVVTQYLELSSDSYRIRVQYPSTSKKYPGFSIRIQDRLRGTSRRVSELSPEVTRESSRKPIDLDVPARGSTFHVKMLEGDPCENATYHLFILGKVDPATGAPLRESVTFSLTPLCEENI